MDVKEILAKIKAAAGEEIAPKIDGLLKSVEAEFATITDDLKAANAESKERKLKIRELTGQLEETGEKVKEYEGRVNDPALKQEFDALKQFKADVLKGRRESFAGEFAKITKHPNFEKAKEQFRLPKPTESGEYDFTKAADADIEHNMQKMSEYQKIGFFGEEQPAGGSGFNLPRNQGGEQPPVIKSAQDLQAHLAKQLSTYK
jgi:predicted  nucleic acid-binding Zn-ribbon protein